MYEFLHFFGIQFNVSMLILIAKIRLVLVEDDIFHFKFDTYKVKWYQNWHCLKLLSTKFVTKFVKEMIKAKEILKVTLMLYV